MSDLENRTEIAELREQYESLGQQVRMLLYGLVVASFTLTAYLGIQARRAGTELDAIQPQATQMAEISKREDINASNLLSQLVEFGKTHPDFAAILEKYNVKMRPPGSVATAPAAKP